MESPVENERNKELELRKMKRNALILLGIVVLLFIVALYFKIGWLTAFSEAAMVGGIADWFAVVALFRHPLGIPIPHTALIPNKKDKIGLNLGNFISDEFLTREKLESKVDDFNFPEKASDWLSDPQNANSVASMIAEDLIPGILKTIDDDDIRHFIKSQFNKKIENVNFGEWLAVGLETLSKSERQEQLISNIFEKLKRELEINQTIIEERVRKATPSFTFGIFDKSLAKGIYNGFYNFIDDASQAGSSIRERINHELNRYIEDLKTSPEMQKTVNDLIYTLVNNKEIQDYINGIWLEIKDAINNDLAKKDESNIKKSIASMIQTFGRGFKEDELMVAKINNFIKNDLLSIVIHNKQHIGDLISGTVKSWEATEVSKKLELEIGSDLQYIRISGTLVGGCAGLAIYAVVNLFSYFAH